MLYSWWVICNLSASKSEPQCLLLPLFCVMLPHFSHTSICALPLPFLACRPLIAIPRSCWLTLLFASLVYVKLPHSIQIGSRLMYRMGLWFSYILSGKFLKIIFLNCHNIISKYNKWRSWNEILDHIVRLIFSCSIKANLTAGFGHHFKSKPDFIVFDCNIIHKCILYMPIFLIFVDSF